MFGRVLVFIGLEASYSQTWSREIYTNRTLKNQTNLQTQFLQTTLQADFEIMIGVKNICHPQKLLSNINPHLFINQSVCSHTDIGLYTIHQIRTYSDKDYCETLKNFGANFELLNVGLYSYWVQSYDLTPYFCNAMQEFRNICGLCNISNHNLFA